MANNRTKTKDLKQGDLVETSDGQVYNVKFVRNSISFIGELVYNPTHLDSELGTDYFVINVDHKVIGANPNG